MKRKYNGAAPANGGIKEISTNDFNLRVIWEIYMVLFATKNEKYKILQKENQIKNIK